MSLTRMAVFGRMMVAVTLLCVAERIVQTAVVPLSADSQAESELSSLAQQPPPLGLSDKGDAERMLQSAQDTPDTYEKALQDIVQGDKNVDLVQDSAEQGNGESQNILEEALQEEKDKTGWPEDSESFDTDKNSSALKQLEITTEDKLHSDASQETELLDLVDESDKTDRDYDKASRGIHRPEEEGSDVGGHAKVAAGQSSEDSSPSDEDYDGFGSDDTDKEGWREVPNTDKLADDLPAFPSDGWGPVDGPGGDVSLSMHRERSNIPLSPLNTDQLDEVRPYLNDAIPNRGGSDDVHDDVKRGQDFVQVPGFPPLRVIELNETIYLNNTDHETQVTSFCPLAHCPTDPLTNSIIDDRPTDREADRQKSKQAGRQTGRQTDR